MRRCLVLVFLLFLGKASLCQFNNAALENRIRPDSSLTGELHFDFYNLNFVRNYEYTNNFHDGYTIYGAQFQPQLVYYAHPNLALTGGVFYRKDFGNGGISLVKPLFSIKYQKNDLSLIFGSLEGGIQHHYVEPIYDFERQLTNPLEYGTQFLLEKKVIKLDAWIAWQNMIYKGSDYKEEIIGGLSMEATVAENNGWKLSLPGQFLAQHRGGQIDELKQIPVQTLFNGATGIKLHKKFQGRVKEVYTDNYIVGYKDLSKQRDQNYLGGFGLWLTAGMDTKYGSLLATYWGGNNFITIKGMPLYESVSENLYDQGFTQNHRNVLSVRYAYQKELLPNFYLDVRFEPHFDLDHADHQLQFNHSFFLTYKKSFKLLKIK
ncbi:hypothetical protein [Pedobacter sp.]|jgi:hypothetical protein|uniref:hypothetical protein n=1 Tax=Pedobacter sp. TaxID=1411316 RepID=UPI002C97BCD1|nr:hypothetical protein [Pedobacter sp.]HWW39132.1 hypothetical protein [Pedobacter sp.]